MKKSALSAQVFCLVWLFQLCFLFPPTLLAQQAPNRTLGERVRMSPAYVPEGAPLGAYGELAVIVRNNAYVDSYNSDVGPYPGKGVHHGGDTRSNHHIYMDNNIDIYGDAVVPEDGSIEMKNHAMVHGETLFSGEMINLLPITIPEDLEYTQEGDPRILKWNSDEPAVPGKWGDYEIVNNVLTVRTNKRIRLKPGQYRFSGFVQSNNSKLRALDRVEMYVEESFVLENNSDLLPPIDIEDRATNMYVYYNGVNKINLRNNTTFYGLLYSPNATVEVRNNNSVYGAIMAKELIIQNNASVHVDEALYQTGFKFIEAGSQLPHRRDYWREIIQTP